MQFMYIGAFRKSLSIGTQNSLTFSPPHHKTHITVSWIDDDIEMDDNLS